MALHEMEMACQNARECVCTQTHTRISHIPYICAPSQKKHTQTHANCELHIHLDLWSWQSCEVIDLQSIHRQNRREQTRLLDIFSKQDKQDCFIYCTVINTGISPQDTILSSVLPTETWALYYLVPLTWRVSNRGADCLIHVRATS